MVTEARETAGLIGSDKVDGTNVYGADRQKIGSIERVMINKKSGPSRLRRSQLRRLSRNGRRSLPHSLATTHVRHRA